METNLIIDEARTWIGTPFHHQARAKGIGCDCLGLIVSTFNNLGASIIDRASYARYPTGNYLIEGMREQFIEVPNPEIGDVLVMAERRHANHVMLYNGDTVIHSYYHAGGVVEQESKLFMPKVIGVFRYEWS